MSTKLSKKDMSLRASLAEAVYALSAEEALGNFKSSELKEHCKTFKLDTIGQKLDLIARLGEYLKDFVDLPPSPEPVAKTAKKNGVKDKNGEESLPSPEPDANASAKKNSLKDKKEEERRVKDTPTPQQADEKRGKPKKVAASPKDVKEAVEVVETPAVLDVPTEAPEEEAAIDLENDEFLSAMRIVSHDEAVERLEGMKVGELRDQCKRLGLDCLKKNKAALVSMVSELIHKSPAKVSSSAEHVEEAVRSPPKSDQHQEESVAEELNEKEPEVGDDEKRPESKEIVEGHRETEQNDAAQDRTSDQTALPCATVISRPGHKAALPVQAREPSSSLFSEKAKQSWMQHLQDAFLASKQEEDDCRRGSKAEHQDSRKRLRVEEAHAEKEPEDCQKRQRIEENVEDKVEGEIEIEGGEEN